MFRATAVDSFTAVGAMFPQQRCNESALSASIGVTARATVNIVDIVAVSRMDIGFISGV